MPIGSGILFWTKSPASSSAKKRATRSRKAAFFRLKRLVLADGTRICCVAAKPNSIASARIWSTPPSRDESKRTPSGAG